MTDEGVWTTLARSVREVNAANGWEPPTWASLPVKIMLVITELDEARDAMLEANAGEENNLGEELADVAIRLLDMLEAVWPGAWSCRSTVALGTVAVFNTPAESLWPVVSWCCDAVEWWRDDKTHDARMCLEYALVSTVRLYDSVRGAIGGPVSLTTLIEAKIDKNRARTKLHGRARADG